MSYVDRLDKEDNWIISSLETGNFKTAFDEAENLLHLLQNNEIPQVK